MDILLCVLVLHGLKCVFLLILSIALLSFIYSTIYYLFTFIYCLLLKLGVHLPPSAVGNTLTVDKHPYTTTLQKTWTIHLIHSKLTATISISFCAFYLNYYLKKLFLSMWYRHSLYPVDVSFGIHSLKLSVSTRSIWTHFCTDAHVSTRMNHKDFSWTTMMLTFVVQSKMSQQLLHELLCNLVQTLMAVIVHSSSSASGAHSNVTTCLHMSLVTTC